MSGRLRAAPIDEHSDQSNDQIDAEDHGAGGRRVSRSARSAQSGRQDLDRGQEGQEGRRRPGRLALGLAPRCPRGPGDGDKAHLQGHFR